MANEEHLEILKQGVAGWNQWRIDNPQVEPDLSGADLHSSRLARANLSQVYLDEANLGSADLTKATLTKARIGHASLISTNFESAQMVGVDFMMSDLRQANFRGANLRQAEFLAANLTGADIAGADCSFGVVGFTIFGDIDLREVNGLHTLIHNGPSVIGIDTLLLARFNLPAEFLRGAGIPQDFIDSLQSSRERGNSEYFSCFLSHAKSDAEIADKLRHDLQANNINCWHYRYDMRGGRFWRVQINEAIKKHDKLILICSKDSLLRRNVVEEVISAMERERESGEQKLFPVRIDDFILSDEILSEADEKMAKGEWSNDWVRYVRSYHIPNFESWEDDQHYSIEFHRLVEALRSPAQR